MFTLYYIYKNICIYKIYSLIQKLYTLNNDTICVYMYMCVCVCERAKL